MKESLNRKWVYPHRVVKPKNDPSAHSDLFYTKHPCLSHVDSITLNPMIHVSEVCYDAFSANYFCLRITVITFWVAKHDLNCSHESTSSSSLLMVV